MEKIWAKMVKQIWAKIVKKNWAKLMEKIWAKKTSPRLVLKPPWFWPLHSDGSDSARAFSLLEVPNCLCQLLSHIVIS